MVNTHQYRIDITQALRALNNLEKGFDRVAKSTDNLRAMQKAASAVSKTLGNRLDTLSTNAKAVNSALRSSAGRIDNFNNRISEGTRNLRGLNTGLSDLGSASQAIAQQLQQSASLINTLHQAAQQHITSTMRNAAAQELWAKWVGKSNVQLSTNAQNLETQIATTVRLSAVKKEITDRILRQYETTRKLEKANRDIATAQAVAAFTAGTTVFTALSRETQAYISARMAAIRLKTATEALTRTERENAKAIVDQANAQRKLRIAQELNNFADGKTTTLSAEADAVYKSKQAALLLAEANHKLTATMTGKNIKLNEQEKAHRRDIRAMWDSVGMVGNLGAAWNRLQRIITNFAGYGSLFLFWQRLRESVRDAREYERAVSEIRTISDRAAVSTEMWNKELTVLSNLSGHRFLDVASAAYETLSNQISEGADTFGFLRESINLSLITVSSMEASVNSLSAVINSFGMNTREASNITTILFRGVDLGRFRLEEIGNTLGRVSILSKQLSVSLIEQTAALSLLTRQGVPVDEGMTLLRNVMQKLIRPTDAMKNLLASWGFTSGKVAVQTLGLVGIMQRFEEHAGSMGDELAEIGELFGRLRATVGALGLSQGRYNDEVKAYTDIQKGAYEALVEQIESTAVRADRATAQIQNFFVNTFGRPILKQLLDWTDKLGGAEAAIVSLIRIGVKAISTFIAYRGAVFAVSAASRAYVLVQYAMATAAVRATMAQQGLTRAIVIGRTAQHAATLGLTLLASVVISSMVQAETAYLDVSAAATQFTTELQKQSQLSSARIFGNIDNEANKTKLAIEGLTKTMFTALSNIAAQNHKITLELRKQWADLGRNLDIETKKLERAGSGIVDQLQNKIDEIVKAREAATSGKKEEQFKLAIDEVIINTEGMDTKNMIARFAELRANHERLATEAIQKGDKELYDLRIKQLEQLQAVEEKMISDSVGKVKTKKKIWDDVNKKWRQDKFGNFLFKEEETDNPKDQALAEQAILDIEKERLAIRERMLELETQYHESQKQTEADLRKELEIKQKEFTKFQQLLAELDTTSFAEGTGEEFANFRAKIQEAQNVGTSLGIAPTQMAEFMRNANAQIALAEKLAATQKRQNTVSSANQMTQKLEDSLIAAVERSTAAEKDAKEAIVTTLPERLGGSLIKILENLEKVEIGGAPESPAEYEAYEMQRKLLEEQRGVLQDAIKAVRSLSDPDTTPEQREQDVKFLGEALKYLKISDKDLRSNIKEIGTSYLTTDPKAVTETGEIKLDPSDRWSKDTITSLIRDMLLEYQQAKDTMDRQYDADQERDILLKRKAELEGVTDGLPANLKQLPKIDPLNNVDFLNDQSFQNGINELKQALQDAQKPVASNNVTIENITFNEVSGEVAPEKIVNAIKRAQRQGRLGVEINVNV